MKAKFFFVAIIFAIVSFLTVSTASAQGRPLPEGARILDKASLDAAIQTVKNSRSSTNMDASSLDRDGAGRYRPMFVIRVYGDSEIGISAIAQNVDRIPAGTTMIGTRRFNGNADYLWGITFLQDVDANSLWYQIENGKRASYEPGGTISYEMQVIAPEGGVTTYSAEKNYLAFYTQTPHQTILDGISARVNDGVRFYLFGRFVGNVGVSIRDADSGNVISIPNAAVSANSFRVSVDMSQVPYWYYSAGDFDITVVDGTRRSDTFRVRLAPPGGNGRTDEGSQLKLDLLNQVYGRQSSGKK